MSKLENVYNLIVRERPIFAKPGSKKNVRYAIHDNFLNFWFKYIERNRSYIELQNYDDLLSLAMDDYPTYSGRILEKYFRQKLAEAGGFKGREALIAEVKRNPNNYNHKLFMEKVEHLQQKEMAKYTLETKLFSLKDM